MNSSATRIRIPLGGWEVGVRGPRAKIDALGAVLQAVVIPESEMPPLEIDISEGGQIRGMIDGRTVWSFTRSRRGWLTTLVGYTVGSATAVLRELLFLHAAAVEVNGRGYVLAGAPGSGKTSAAALLVRGGGAYLTDEVALLDPRTALLHPFALPLAVKPWTAAAIGRLPPGRQVASDDSVSYVLPERRAAGPVPLDALILLDPDRGAGPGTTPLSRAEMLLALSRHPSSFRYRPRLESAFTGFVHVLRRARCHRIGSAVPAQAAAAVAALAGTST